ncbi:hypothetical protein T265_11148 [Opisthorchis viverrini]|uniref:BPTI/Kunitz inhibitor domain-containing protein n=1 Tax=Opisthorchis viverrini TaxID=6198 RepID=A0A074YZQ6_OPIVI|nr:hypothetical protein T265_11148 [Opisthorchis viverrini]KER20266.1 hypothetical protein T265_11148 [Opisthorchis viverrini]
MKQNTWFAVSSWIVFSGVSEWKLNINWEHMSRHQLFLFLLTGAFMSNACFPREKDICKHRYNTGGCFVTATTKYHFDVQKKQCVPYKDTCGNSENRFDTIDQCKMKCKHLMDTH